MAAAARPAIVIDPRTRTQIVVAVMLGLFLAALDQTIVGTALPRIVTDLHGNDIYTWAFTAYLLTATISGPIYGKLSDLFGRRPVLLFAVAVFLIGSLLSGFSREMWQLVAFRALQGLGAGMVFRTYSGYPINETTGTDANGDGTSNNDRPTKGVNDLTLPIVSALDSRGVAIRNGLEGQKKTILDGRFQYVQRLGRYQAGFFLEVYNLTNHNNFGDPTGARNSAFFMKTIVADNPRTAQLRFRLLF